VGGPARRSGRTPAAERVTQTTAVPGWYADPANAAGLRWWDGVQWTPYASTPPVPEDPREDGLFWIAPVGRAWQAIAAGYLGILVLFAWPLGPVAIGFGVWALRVMRHKHSYGRGRAWFGIIAGAISTAFFAIYVFH
jgi:Domain of unknown function (DUF4190)/Protein of unknown function (DUF2510)